MNRRKFLGLLSTVPVAAAIAEPLTRTIFLPPRGGWPTWSCTRDPYMASYTFQKYAQSFTITEELVVDEGMCDLTEESIERIFRKWAGYERIGKTAVIEPMQRIVLPSRYFRKV